jgi:hypothetical protein
VSKQDSFLFLARLCILVGMIFERKYVPTCRFEIASLYGERFAVHNVRRVCSLGLFGPTMNHFSKLSMHGWRLKREATSWEGIALAGADPTPTR